MLRIGNKPLRGRVQRIWIFQPAHPTRRIIETDALILVLEKRTWAETPSGRRHLLGSSSFFTKVAAERAKRGALAKIVETRALYAMQETRSLYLAAEDQLQLFESTGTFDYPKRSKIN